MPSWRELYKGCVQSSSLSCVFKSAARRPRPCRPLIKPARPILPLIPVFASTPGRRPRPLHRARRCPLPRLHHARRCVQPARTQFIRGVRLDCKCPSVGQRHLCSHYTTYSGDFSLRADGKARTVIRAKTTKPCFNGSMDARGQTLGR